MLVILTLINVFVCLALSYLTFKTLEAVHELRECKKRNPSGGYYQRWSIAEHLAAKYLISQCEIGVEKLPQGGYNVYRYNWNRTLLLPGESFGSLDD